MSVTKAGGEYGARPAEGLHNRHAEHTQPSSQSSIEPKFDLDTDLHINRPAVLGGRLKAPLHHGVDGFSVQPMSQSMNHTDVARMPLVIDDQPEHAGSLGLGGAGFFGVYGIRRRNGL